MKAEIRERALRAAARVALAAVSTGCGGVTEATPEAGATGAVEPVQGVEQQGAATAVGEPPTFEGESPSAPGKLADSTVSGGEAPLPASTTAGGSATEPAVAGTGVGGAAGAPEPEHRCGLPPAPGVADADMLACCDAFVRPMFHESGLAFKDREAARADSEVLACCSLLTDVGQFGEHHACCEVLDFPPGPVCAPWGPPVPPLGVPIAMEMGA